MCFYSFFIFDFCVFWDLPNSCVHVSYLSGLRVHMRVKLGTGGKPDNRSQMFSWDVVWPSAVAGRSSCGRSLKLWSLLNYPRTILETMSFSPVCQTTHFLPLAHLPLNHKAPRRRAYLILLNTLHICFPDSDQGLKYSASSAFWITLIFMTCFGQQTHSLTLQLRKTTWAFFV